MNALRAAQLVRLFASDRDGEVVAAVRALDRLLRAQGRDWFWLSQIVERNFAPVDAKPWQALAMECLRRGHGKLDPYELRFLKSMTTSPRPPSSKQSEWLGTLAERFEVEAA